MDRRAERATRLAGSSTRSGPAKSRALVVRGDPGVGKTVPGARYLLFRGLGREVRGRERLPRKGFRPAFARSAARSLRRTGNVFPFRPVAG